MPVKSNNGKPFGAPHQCSPPYCRGTSFGGVDSATVSTSMQRLKRPYQVSEIKESETTFIYYALSTVENRQSQTLRNLRKVTLG